MDLEVVRNQVVAIAKRMAEANMALGTAGNISARWDHSSFAITPSGIPYAAMCGDDVCVVSTNTGWVVVGERKPSSETPMHLEVYRNRADVGAIVHTHSLFATAHAAATKSIPPLHYVISTLGNEIPLVPYCTFGTDDLAAAVRQTLVVHPGVNGLLLQNHGVLAFGRNLDEAYYHAETIEYLAKLSYLATGLGGAEVLSVTDLATVRERFHGYGQS